MARRSPPLRIPSLVEIDRALAARGLAEFVRIAWPILEPSEPLIWSWHMDAVCEHAQAVYLGELRRCLIAVPPGTAKSLITTVFAPAWTWGPGKRPSHRALCASYSGALSTRDSVRCRRLIESPWYQERWPLKLAGDQNVKTRFENDRTGFRVATSVGGTVTGDRGNLIVCDDLLDRRRADSAAYRFEASEFFWSTLPTRLNDHRRDGILVIAQRLHQGDTIGEILDREPEKWEKLVLPLEYEPARRCFTSLGFEDPRTEDGESLHPERFTPEVIQGLKDTLRHQYPGQAQQRPAPREGNIVKYAWFGNRFRERGKDPIRLIVSIDCASKAAERNDPTGAEVFAEFQDHIELWHAETGRREFPALVRWAKDLAAAWSPTAMLIEDKDAGQQLIQQLKADTRIPVIACNPGSIDKVTRMDAETPALEAGKLWLPESEPWVAAFLAEVTTFPAAAHDEMVDCLSQGLRYLREAKERTVSAAPIVLGRVSRRL